MERNDIRARQEIVLSLAFATAKIRPTNDGQNNKSRMEGKCMVITHMVPQEGSAELLESANGMNVRLCN